jgi:dimethylhistidine N-methyltransferase
MEGSQASAPAGGAFELFDRQPDTADVTEELLSSLGREQKSVSAKFFYDQRGSELFEAITRLPEYYLTRTEMALFEALGAQLKKAIGPDCCLVEYGSGSSRKIRQLLESVAPRAYVPVDISLTHMEHNARELHADFPALDVFPTCADITCPFELPAPVAELNKVGFFPGSSIGNFAPDDAITFLANVADTLGAGSRLILGVDRKKDRALLEAAYNDAAGVTAQFNLNMIDHIGSLLGVDFTPAQFVHRAFYDDEAGCIRMFLEATRAHQVRAAERTITFAAGERLHTENSFKYAPEEFRKLAREGGFQQLAHWSDDQEWFSVFLLEVAS